MDISSDEDGAVDSSSDEDILQMLDRGRSGVDLELYPCSQPLVLEQIGQIDRHTDMLQGGGSHRGVVEINDIGDLDTEE